ncbi:hypothetical protein [Abditibacterium utsteinense]|uniref:hypothetical protein n=1 Tax=Abditibacterium utsteinense TaxID=1960156 RepID=UPI000F47E239|nr:hypothetical protein [Abditibacterium utsteinense]
MRKAKEKGREKKGGAKTARHKLTQVHRCHEIKNQITARKNDRTSFAAFIFCGSSFHNAFEAAKFAAEVPILKWQQMA